MRTRKAKRRGGTRTSEYYPLRGFKYTNPTSSTLNLNLYSKQVGGRTCEEKQTRYCKKSCKKLCRYVETLPKQDYINKLNTEEALLKAEIERKRPMYAELKKNAIKYHITRITPEIHPKSWQGAGFDLFESPDNEDCTKSCEKSCVKNQTEICNNIHRSTFKTEKHYSIELLKEELAKLDLGIAHLQQRI